MSIKKVKIDDNVFVLEFTTEDKQFKSVYYDSNTKHDMKSKLKEYHKNGTLTFSNIESNKIRNIVYHPLYVKVSKVIEMYVKEKDEQNISTAGEVETA